MNPFDKTIKCPVLLQTIINELKSSVPSFNELKGIERTLFAEVSIGKIAERILENESIVPNKINAYVIYHYFIECRECDKIRAK